MSKRPANSPENNNAAPPKPRPWAKYLTAVALGLTAGWLLPPQAQAPDVMEDLIVNPNTEEPQAQAVPAPPGPNALSEQPRGLSESLIVVPPPPWQRIKDRPAQGLPILPGLKPEFGTAQGAWRNLDVGQANETPPPLTGETATGDQFGQPIQAPAITLRQALPPGRKQLKDLFGDMFVSDTDQTEPNLAGAAPPSELNEAAASSPAPESEAREPAGLARIIAPGHPGLKAAAKADEPKAAPPAAASPPKASSAASARLNRPPKQTPGVTTPRGPLPPPGPSGSPKPYLVLINETGHPETGREYQRVLEAMNYKVIAVHDHAPQQGATFISYRPGQKAQARELSRRLPGKRLALEAQSGECLPTEITIYIR